MCYFVASTKNFEKSKISYLLEKTLVLSIICSKCKNEDEKIFNEEESIKILKIFCLINNIEEYQNIYNNVWRKHESRI